MTINPISIAFVLSALGLSLFVALVLIWPVLRAGRERQHSLLDLNVQVFEERLLELEQDKSEGKVDAETFNALKTELERQLLSLAAQPKSVEAAKSVGRLTAVGVFLVVPVMAAIAYGVLSYKPELWHWWQVQTQTGPVVDKLFVGMQPTTEELEKQNLADFARVMQLRLQEEPKNPDGWYMLGMAFLQGELVDQAAIAFSHANRLDPQRDDIALSYAQTLVFSQRGQLSTLSRELLMQVLNKNPQHEGALLLMGMGAYRSGDFAGALVFLAAIKEVDQAIALAQQGGEKVVVAGGGIRVTVTVTKELLGKIQPTDTIFIFARALNGPPMPLAVVRQAVGSFPLTVELNDTQSMIPDMKLSKFPSVVVNARISKSGTPQGASGDLEAVAVPLTQDGKLQQVELIINQVKP